MKLQTFLTASAASSTLQPKLSDFQAAAGVGLVGKLLDVARIELNLCVPLSLGQAKYPGPSLQFGIGTALEQSRFDILKTSYDTEHL